MVFSFESQLRLIIPVSKGSNRVRTLEVGLDRVEVPDRVKYWFPVMGQIILNCRQKSLRAYHSLPDHYLLFYEERDKESQGFRWKRVLRIKAHRNGTIDMFDYETKESVHC